MSRAVVLLSGGLDSTTALYWAKSRGYAPVALCVRYGQRHTKEVAAARKVARRAGVSHAAPYRHFADKDALIVAVVERGFDLMRDTMQAQKATAGDDPLSQFTASGMAYVEFALQYPAYYRVMFSGDLINSEGHVSLQHTSNQHRQ